MSGMAFGINVTMIAAGVCYLLLIPAALAIESSRHRLTGGTWEKAARRRRTERCSEGHDDCRPA